MTGAERPDEPDGFHRAADDGLCRARPVLPALRRSTAAAPPQSRWELALARARGLGGGFASPSPSLRSRRHRGNGVGAQRTAFGSPEDRSLGRSVVRFAAFRRVRFRSCPFQWCSDLLRFVCFRFARTSALPLSDLVRSGFGASGLTASALMPCSSPACFSAAVPWLVFFGSFCLGRFILGCLSLGGSRRMVRSSPFPASLRHRPVGDSFFAASAFGFFLGLAYPACSAFSCLRASACRARWRPPPKPAARPPDSRCPVAQCACRCRSLRPCGHSARSCRIGRAASRDAASCPAARPARLRWGGF